MPSLHHDRRRNVMHDLTGIAPVGLQQERLPMVAATLANRVIENALGPIVHEIDFFVAGQRLGKGFRLWVGT